MLPILSLSSPSAALSPDDYFHIRIVDAETGRGVPAVEILTINDISYFTDSAGNVAVYEPGLMGKNVWISLNSPGYQFSGPARKGGIHVKLERGGSATFEVKRVNIAERIYRVTGPGLYRHSVVLNEPVPIEKPVLNGHITGQDSVVNVLYKDKLYWFWGDSGILDEVLGVFSTTGATSELPSRGGLNPDQGVNLNYITADNNEARGIFPRSIGELPIWPRSVLVLKDDQSNERMFSLFSEGSGHRGLAEWNDQKDSFGLVKTFPKDMKVRPCSNAFRIRVNDQEWFYFSCPYPIARVPARVKALQDTSQYQALTPFEPGSAFEPGAEIERDDAGNPVWGWKENTFSFHAFRRIILLRRSGLIDSSENVFHTRSVHDTRPVVAHRGTVYWNEFRQKWIMVFVEIFGKSSFQGNLWYAEADSPIGPWVYSRRIAIHNGSTCYNVKQHRMFDRQNGRKIFFECTFTSPHSTSRYNYNQLMYRLDLADTRLHLPTPVYHYQDPGNAHRSHRYDTLHGLTANQNKNRGTSGRAPAKSGVNPDSIAKHASIPFYALPADRPRPESVPVWEQRAPQGAVQLTLSQPRSARSDSPVFYAYAPAAQIKNSNLIDVYEFEHQTSGQLIYRTSDPGSDWTRNGVSFQAWSSPNKNPPREPTAEPTRACIGAAAYCD